MNSTSSRSHAIFTIELKHYSPSNSLPVTCSTLNIIDLAGSERSKNNHLDRLAEAGSINRSLMVLGQCSEVLKRNQHKNENSINGTNANSTHVNRTRVPGTNIHGNPTLSTSLTNAVNSSIPTPEKPNNTT